MLDYQHQQVSFWFDTFPEKIQPRPPLSNSSDVDIAIIGAGYTGLWTAYYLKRYQPELNIAIFEADTVGYGASGRNGGWLMGAMAGDAKYLRLLAPEQRRIARQLITSIVNDVRDILIKEKIDCDFAHGGSVYAAARYPEQLNVQETLLKHLYQLGFSEDDYVWLSEHELQGHVRIRGGMGGIYTPHCAAINPAKLVRGLASCLEQKGVAIYENSRVSAIDKDTITVESSVEQLTVRANVIVPVTEGFSGDLLGLNRYLLPVQSLIVATEPLSRSQWDEIGIHQRQTFSDASRLITYGQRSADNRMIFGSRGGYCYGGKVKGDFSLADSAFRSREATLRDLFPSLQSVAITHGWGGTLGIARNFAPFAVFDPKSGIASAGGYAGEGVGASNLFGRTLADLILQRTSVLTEMPWVFSPASHASVVKRWEPEPCRWLAYKMLSSIFSWEEKIYTNAQASQWKKDVMRVLCDKLSLLLA